MTFAHTSGGVELRWIEEASFNGSQTQRQLFYDGWLLRVLPGETKRTRSVNAHFGSTLPVKVKIDYCERVYEERALPTLFRITPFIAPRDLEDALAARGYESFQPTLVQVAGPAQAPQVVDMPDVEIAVTSIPEFVMAFGALQGSSSEQRAAHLERLAQSPLTTRAVLPLCAGRAVASGQAVLEDGLAGVFSVVTEKRLPRTRHWERDNRNTARVGLGPWCTPRLSPGRAGEW